MECRGTDRRPIQSQARCQWIAEVVGIEFITGSGFARNVKGCYVYVPVGPTSDHKQIGYSQGNDAGSHHLTHSACFNQFEWEAQVRQI